MDKYLGAFRGEQFDCILHIYRDGKVFGESIDVGVKGYYDKDKNKFEFYKTSTYYTQGVPDGSNEEECQMYMNRTTEFYSKLAAARPFSEFSPDMIDYTTEQAEPPDLGTQKVDYSRDMDLTPVQKVAIETICEVHRLTFDELYQEVFGTVPPLDELLYIDAVRLIQYGNSWKRMEQTNKEKSSNE